MSWTRDNPSISTWMPFCVRAIWRITAAVPMCFIRSGFGVSSSSVWSVRTTIRFAASARLTLAMATGCDTTSGATDIGKITELRSAMTGSSDGNGRSADAAGAAG